MQWTAIILLAGCLQASAAAYGQKVTLVEKDVSLRKVFREIRKQTGYNFIYTNKVIGQASSVSLDVKDADVLQVLEKCFAHQPLSYVIDDRIIIITAKPARTPADTLRQKEVHGLVTASPGGGPLAGVSVQLKGTATGAVTDGQGRFSLLVPAGGVLVFTSLGYEKRELAPGGDTLLHVALAPSTLALDQLVVVGYGTQEKKDLTGAISTISTDKMSSLPVPDAGAAMEGAAPGVQVVASGAPGSNVTFRIRGTGTINNSDPLLVIDGVPTDIPLNTLNPDDIASIQVLKDASAAAIYGSRGANGVVLITTKKGQKEPDGKGHLSVNFYTAWQSATHVVPMLNASQFALLNNDMMTANGQPTNPAYAKPDTLGAGTDWLGALLRTAPMQNYALSYSGGSDKYTYYVSGSYLNQQGIVINTAYKRYTLQFNSQATVFKWLKFGNNLTLEHDEKPSGAYNIQNAMAANPVQPIHDADGSWSGPAGNPMWYGDIRNPIGTATLTKNNTSGYNVLGSLYAEATLPGGLTFRTTGGMQAGFWDSRSWSPAYDWKPIAQPLSYLSEQYNKSITLLWDNYFTWDKSFGDHHITLLAGSSAQNNRLDYMNGNISDFASDLTRQLSNGTTNPVVGGDASEWALLSFMGRVNYAYRDKFLFTGTVRRDGSSRFGSDNKWGTFPSASVAWRISREPFFSGVHFVNDLKIRLGYGVTGNQNIGNYSFASVLQTAQYNFNNQIVSTVFPNMLPNPDVKWETVRQSNLGVDATLFTGRITLEADAYVKNTTNMLVPAVVPISSGYSSTEVPFINAGKVRNRGLELTVTSKNLTGAFSWNTSVNLSWNRNRIVSLNDTVPLFGGSIGLNDFLNIDQAGHPVGELYGYVTQGLFQNAKQVSDHAVQQPGADPYNRTSAGDIRFMDLNNDGVINAADRTYIGNPSPTFIFAVDNSFAYRGFDLDIFLQGVSGNNIFNANNIYQEGMSVGQNQTAATLKRWHGEGTSGSMPRAVYNDPNQNTRPSTRFIEDGSYLRIKTVTLGYTLPGNLVRHTGFSSVRIYASCFNLYTFTRYSGFDPEVPVSGIDFNVYPVTRTLSAGINLNL
jgi:TonB-linked SusC/RagA family outer membrane protein